MRWIHRATAAAFLVIGVEGCGAAPGAPPASVGEGVPSAIHAGVCPPGSISDGRRCRSQRGIIIDQLKPQPGPRPPEPEPPPHPEPPPRPLPAPRPPS